MHIHGTTNIYKPTFLHTHSSTKHTHTHMQKLAHALDAMNHGLPQDFCTKICDCLRLSVCRSASLHACICAHVTCSHTCMHLYTCIASTHACTCVCVCACLCLWLCSLIPRTHAYVHVHPNIAIHTTRPCIIACAES